MIGALLFAVLMLELKLCDSWILLISSEGLSLLICSSCDIICLMSDYDCSGIEEHEVS